MNPGIRKLLRRVIGQKLYSTLQAIRRERANQRFAGRQGTIQLQIGNFTLAVPSGHILTRIQKSQPLRDLAIGITARELSKKYPTQTLVDIGANIGDTAAMMATYSSNPIIAVEPSDFYYPFLQENSKRIPTVSQIHHVMISPNAQEQGVLIHKGGTAQFERLDGSNRWNRCKPLADVAGPMAKFIKIDTDGFDLSIIAGSISFLADHLPCLYYEEYLTDELSLALSERVLDDLYHAGYRHFCVFNDVGELMTSTTDLAVIREANHALFLALTDPTNKGPFNYDVLCFSDCDRDVFDEIVRYYRERGYTNVVSAAKPRIVLQSI